MRRITGSTRRGARLLVPLSLLALVPFLDAASAAAPRLPSLSISPPASIAELDQGTTSATFAVKLSSPSRSAVRVRFKSVGSFATQGTDYRATAGTLVFKPGQRTKQIVVQIIGDTVPEDVEDFYIHLWKRRTPGSESTRPAARSPRATFLRRSRWPPT